MADARPAVVLYAEDEETDRFFMRHAFTAAGLAGVLRIVDDGQAAIQYLAGHGPYADRSIYPVPTLLLLDLKMPRLSGFDVLDWLRKNPDYADLPVVIFSSSPHPGDRHAAHELGADEYWEKPASATLYSNLVSGLCQRWLFPDQSRPQSAA